MHSLEVCSSLCGEKPFFVNIFTGLNKKNCSNKSKFSSGLANFKHGKKYKLSEYFSNSFGDSHFYVLKGKFTMNFPQNASKQQKGIV